MNSQSAERQTAKELREQLDGKISDHKINVDFINNPERRLTNARDNVASLREVLAQREAYLASLEAFIANPFPQLDAEEARIEELRQDWLKAKNRERLQKWLRVTSEIANLENDSENSDVGNPERVDEEMIVS